MVCGSNGGQSVELVVHASQRPGQLAHFLAMAQHGKVAGVAFGAEIADSSAESAHFAPATMAQHAGQAFFQSVSHHAPGGGNGAHQMVKLAFNRSQIVKDVCVIEF